MHLQTAKEGIFTLFLHNVTIADQGGYTCDVFYGKDNGKAKIDLCIEASPTIKISNISLKWNMLNQVYCWVTGFYPEEMNMTWFKNGIPLLNAHVDKKRNADGTYSVISSVNVTPNANDEYVIIECQVEHSSLHSDYIKAYIVGRLGLMKTFFITSLVFSLICALLMIVTISVFIYRRIAKPQVLDENLIEQGLGDLSSKKASVTAKPQVLDENLIEQGLGNLSSKKASVTELTRCPKMGDIIIPSLVNGTEATLQCKISGYFPDKLEVKWLKVDPLMNKQVFVSPGEKYKIPVMEVTREEDQTYTCTANLIVSVSIAEDEYSEYICQVEHPSLDRPLEKRTGKLCVTGIPTIKVTHETVHRKTWLRTEVKGVFPPTCTAVTWSRDKGKKIVHYPESIISNQWTMNKDGTFKLISKCQDKSRRKKAQKCFHVSVKVKPQDPPVKMSILLDKGILH
ncbi:signal-regulatory beta-1-like isoform X3 [Pelobates cultripes]|uniref:Signal-regulatory beta-1-like isoform X3 n=1 Tax=Pelobates cultripes TaxID=61616 RepID=A0AAD1VL50_PELCU|nr:signal-regulatory beta-1-like isoform X3 [Pelobates cultripes]